MRRVAAKCYILQEGGAFCAKMAARGQFGCGVKNGTELIFSLTTRALDALHAMGTPCVMTESDASNAYCSIHRSEIQRGLAKQAPGLLPLFDFLYGPHAQGMAHFYAGGDATPGGSCSMPSGVHQGGVLGPFFFSVGFDQLLEDVRERMAALPVDSSMVGEVVKVAEGVVTRDASGLVFEPGPQDTFRLCGAPTYQELEAPGEGVAARVVSLALLPGGLEPPEGLDVGLFTVAWDRVVLVAHPLVVAYLDDVSLADKLFLGRPSSRLLRQRGPLYGLSFEKRAKNYLYVPRRFLVAVRAMYPDAVVVEDDSPGEGPGGQLKAAVEANALADPANVSRLLITVCGVESLMGSPFRLLEEGDGPEGRAARAWVRARLETLVKKTVHLFPHLGDEKVNQLAARMGFGGMEGNVPCLPKSELQCRNFLARYCLGRRHVHNMRVVPPAVARGPVRVVDDLLCAVTAGLMGLEAEALSEAQKRRVLLPARHGGVMPGAVGSADAQFLGATLASGERIRQIAARLASAGDVVPPALVAILEREAAVMEGRVSLLSVLEREVAASLATFNEARASPGGAHQRLPISRGGRRLDDLAGENEVVTEVGAARALLNGWRAERGVGGEGPNAQPEESQDAEAPVGGGAQEVGAGAGADGAAGGELRPLSLEDLVRLKFSARKISEPFHVKEFNEVAASSTLQEQRLLFAACIKGAGSFLLAVPSVQAMRVGEQAFRIGLRRTLGVAPVETPHTHHCGNRGSQRLGALQATHMFSCPCLGGNIAPHNAVRDVLAHMIHQCGLTSAVPKVEVLVPLGQGAVWAADIKFVVDATGETVTIDVSLVNTDSVSGGRRGGGPESVVAALVQRENEKRALPAARRGDNEQGSNNTFVPFVMSSSGGFGPSALAFLKKLYHSARQSGKWAMAVGQGDVLTTWNTLYASTYWDMRLSMACTVTSAEVVGRLVVRDHNLNMTVSPQERQPHPDPNFPAYGGGVGVGFAGGRGGA